MKLLAIGVFPPPLSGQNYAFEEFVDFLNEKFLVKKIPLNKFSRKRSIWLKIEKTINILLLSFFFPIYRLCNYSYIYITHDSGLGLILDAWLIFVGKFFGYKFIIHHHSYNFINSPNFLLKIILFFLGESDKSIFLSDYMKIEFNKLYPNKTQSFVITNWFLYRNRKYTGSVLTLPKKVTMGYISVISKEKGIFEALNSFVIMKNKFKFNVELIIAGPIPDTDLKNNLLNCITDFDDVHYIGPVYGENKYNFFQKCDLIIFPTNYKNEAQPIVLLEALITGTPFLSTDKGAIKEYYTESEFLLKNFISDDIDQFTEKLINACQLLKSEHVKIQKEINLVVSKSLQRSNIDIDKFINQL